MNSRSSLRKNVILNTAGSVIPLFLAIVTVPLYLNSVGAARYGVLTLVWLFAGYFSLLDFGISRATVNFISRIDPSDRDGQQKVLWSALWVNLAMGVVGMCVAYPLALVVFGQVQFDDPQMRQELMSAVPWLCLTVPVTLVSAAGQGGLEAKERFDLLNLLGIVGGLATQLLPVVVAYRVSVQLDVLILTILLARAAGMLLLLVVLARAFPVGPFRKWDGTAIRQLVKFGSWASISGIISPILDALDRFVIGAKLSASDVAMYAIPFSIADKLRIVPRALARAAFPRLSSLPQADADLLYRQLMDGSLRLMTPLVLMAVLASKHLLELWIKAPQESISGVVAIVLLCGAWFNSIALIPFVYLQARGFPSVTAKIHMVEFVPFVLILFALVGAFGVVGAALAWSIRMMVDCLLLCAVARRAGGTSVLLRVLAYALPLVATAYWMAYRVLSWYELGGALLLLGTVFVAVNFDTIRQTVRNKLQKGKS